MYKFNDSLKNMILSELGYPTIRVELNSKQLDFQITHALTEYVSFKPRLTYTRLEFSNNQSEYKIHDEENHTITGIGMVIIPDLFHTNNMDLSKSLLFSFLNSPSMNVYNTVDGYRIYLQTISITETIISTSRIRHMVRFIPDTSTIVIEPTPRTNGIGYVSYFTNYHDISEVDQLGKEWVQKRQMAEQKLILGRIRSKYNGVQTPAGQINTDGQQLTQEQQQEIIQLKQDLIKRRDIYSELTFLS